MSKTSVLPTSPESKEVGSTAPLAHTERAPAGKREHTLSEESHHVSHSRQVLDMLFCVAGIYVSFLTWAVLQERISTTPYGPDGKLFEGSLIINTVQSLFATIIGYIYVQLKRKDSSPDAVFSNLTVWKQFGFLALSQSISSPFAYSSLKYVNYITLLLAKSCKLLPLMALHLTLYRRKFPLYKYMVVATITLGVFLFTYCKASSGKASIGAASPSIVGIGLLSVNLLLDGVTSSTQDNMFHTNKAITGPHMMCGLNAMATLLTFAFLLTPFTSQLSESVSFIMEYPKVFQDIVLFAVCGALGQVFIFHTLEKYGSVILVTVTVTRKMFSMLLSVIWFNHKLTRGQWLGVLSVFGAIGVEAYINYLEKKKKAQSVSLDKKQK